MAKAQQQFYQHYHQKNQAYCKLIKKPDFTYFFLQKLIAQALPHLSGKKILDLGCGVGTISLYLAAQGAKVTGIDLAPRAIKLAQQASKSLNLPAKFIQADLDNWLKKNKNKFDLIIMSEILEHLNNDQAILKLVAKQLKTNGQLIITTPSPHNWPYKQGWLNKFDQQAGHLHRYTQAELTALLQQADLKIKLIRQTQGPVRMFLYSGWGGKLGWLIKFIRGPLIPVFHWLDGWLGKVTGRFDWEVVAERQA